MNCKAQENNCEEALFEAEKAFDQGDFEAIPGLLCECFMKVKTKGYDRDKPPKKNTKRRLKFKTERSIGYQNLINKMQIKYKITDNDKYKLDSCFCESKYDKRILSYLLVDENSIRRDTTLPIKTLDQLIKNKKRVKKSIKKKNQYIDGYNSNYNSQTDTIPDIIPIPDSSVRNYLTKREKYNKVIKDRLYDTENNTGIRKINQGKIVIRNKKDTLNIIRNTIIKDELDNKYPPYQKRRALILLSKAYLHMDDRFMSNLYTERLIQEYPSRVETDNPDPNFQKQYDYFYNRRINHKISIGPVIGWNYVWPILKNNPYENSELHVALQPARLIVGLRFNYYPLNYNLSRVYVGFLGFRNSYKFLETTNGDDVESIFIEDQIQFRIPVGFKFTTNNSFRILSHIEGFNCKFFINGGMTIDWLASSKTTYLRRLPIIIAHQQKIDTWRTKWNVSVFLGGGFSFQFDRNLLVIDIDFAKSLLKVNVDKPGLLNFNDIQYTMLNLFTTVTYEYRFNLIRKKYSPSRSKESFW